MAEQRAHVTSVEALESFRTSLILYVSKARPTLEDVSADVLRTRLWLENEQRLHWESQVRRRAKALEQAEQARSTEQMAVRKAKSALEEAEAKLKLLKYWSREFDSRVEPLVKQLEKLHTFLSNDALQANAYLAQAITTLSSYAEMAPPSAAPVPAPAGGHNAAETVGIPADES
jgi:hypothetical protein